MQNNTGRSKISLNRLSQMSRLHLHFRVERTFKSGAEHKGQTRPSTRRMTLWRRRHSSSSATPDMIDLCADAATSLGAVK